MIEQAGPLETLAEPTRIQPGDVGKVWRGLGSLPHMPDARTGVGVHVPAAIMSEQDVSLHGTFSYFFAAAGERSVMRTWGHSPM